MNLLRSVFIILVVAMPAAAQEFQSVRPTYVVPPAAIANRGPVPVWNTPRPAWVIRLPAAPPPLALPSVAAATTLPLCCRWQLPPLLLWPTERGLAGVIIEGTTVLPVGPVTAPPLAALGTGWAWR